MVTTRSSRIYGAFSEADLTVPASDGTQTTIGVRHGFREILIRPGDDVVRLHLVPAIRQIWFFDSSQGNNGTWHNLITPRNTYALVNRHVTGTEAIGGMTSGDLLYIGTLKKVGGYRVAHGQVNATDVGAIMTGANSNGANFDTLTIADGTDTGTGVSFGQTGNITFTVPAPWTASALNGMNLESIPPEPYSHEKLYWVRLATDAGGTVDAATTLSDVTPMPEDATAVGTAAGDSLILQSATDYTIPILSPWQVGGLDLQSDVDASATTAQLTWIRR